MIFQSIRTILCSQQEYMWFSVLHILKLMGYLLPTHWVWSCISLWLLGFFFRFLSCPWSEGLQPSSHILPAMETHREKGLCLTVPAPCSQIALPPDGWEATLPMVVLWQQPELTETPQKECLCEAKPVFFPNVFWDTAQCLIVQNPSIICHLNLILSYPTIL